MLVSVCALLALWTIRPAPAATAPRSAPAPVLPPRLRFVPVGTTRVFTVPGRGSGRRQRRRVFRALEDHRLRGWVPLHDPRPPLYAGDEWLLTFRKER